VKNPRIEKVNIALEEQQLVKRLENDNVHKGTHHEDGQIITEQVTEAEAEAEAVESPTNQKLGEINPETVEGRNEMGNLENGEVQRKEYSDPKLEVTDNGNGTSRNLSSSTLSSNVALGTCDANESNAPVIDEPTSSPQPSVETNENMLPLDESVSDTRMKANTILGVEEEKDILDLIQCRDVQHVAISQDPNVQVSSEKVEVAEPSYSSNICKSDGDPVSKGGDDTGKMDNQHPGEVKYNSKIEKEQDDNDNAMATNGNEIDAKSAVVETDENKLDSKSAIMSKIEDLEVVEELKFVRKFSTRNRIDVKIEESPFNGDRGKTSLNGSHVDETTIQSENNEDIPSIPPRESSIKYQEPSVRKSLRGGSKLNQEEENNLCIDSTTKIRSKEESSECILSEDRARKDGYGESSDKASNVRTRLDKESTSTQSSRKRNRLESRVLEVERVVSDDCFFGGPRKSKRRLRSETQDEIEFSKPQDILFELIRNLRNKVGHFSYPVDPGDDECLDYFEVIDENSEAMDFQTMNDFVQNGKIVNIDDIEHYLKQIVDSSVKYHEGTNNFIYKKARRIEPLAAPIIRKARIKWEELMPSKQPQKTCSRKSRLRRRQPPSAESKDMNVSNSDEDGILQESKTRRSVNKAYLPRDKSSRVLRKRGADYAGMDGKDTPVEGSSNDDQSFNDENLNKTPRIKGSEIPFVERNYELKSSLTTCASREEWLRLCPQITTVCNEAARRSTLKADPVAMCYEKPLSEVYMSERLEYDNPLNGLLMRTKTEPNHIQGFIVTTNFTTWRKTFRWTTDNPASLVTPTDHRLRATDKDGALTLELQDVERVGLDSRTGYTYPRVCEISLLGGLGCGGLLLSRALSDLKVDGQYDYVVLQSTKMAISFYERHGFVRVGAVTRLNDKEGLPEVAYRHWSEMVDGKTVEASYMMARKLNCKVPMPFERRETRSSKSITVKERNIEIESALRSTSCLLFEALSVRATSSAVCINSFRELVIAAKEFARSAEDYDVIEAINKALSSLNESTIGSSKTVLRHELELSKAKLSAYASSKKIEFKKNKTSSGSSFEGKNSIATESDCRNENHVTVSIRYTEEPLSVELCSKLTAVVPDKNLLEKMYYSCGRPQVHVNVTIGGEQFSDEPTEYNGANVCNKLVTFLDISDGRTNAGEVHEASLIAIENLRSMLYEGCPMIADQLEISHINTRRTTIYKGDEIMVRVQAYDGNPLWISAEVTKREKKKDTFIIEWDESEGHRSITRTLSPNNRGVGKTWCTPLDWHSFPLLPMQILDTLLVGSSVLYPDVSGKIVSGTITHKIGGGISSYPTWRLVTHSGDSQDLLAGALREAVHIDDYKISQSVPVLNSFPCIYDKKRQTSRKKHKSQQNELSREDLAMLWAKSRFEEISSYPVAVMDVKRKRIREEKDDGIITLETGVQHDVLDSNQNKKKAKKASKQRRKNKFESNDRDSKMNDHHDMVVKNIESEVFSARALRPRNDSSNQDSDGADGIGSRLRNRQRRR
jgi:predicted GNAT family N-acyltransferase